ncbi:F-box domain, Leucine-rich repeat domain, L domain-like protein [Artemisia annua]|uniref:F-box domain, Leucine-rich repeat domain, L domain-like protein n=1 Tax=Artemisia annua TaxID=35608 RepID=A0A2U1NWM5_ARTAN|nr:F-box domain, Leucine-rich repeat domain, L domain-like protein [Artemisia annua]
MDVEVDRLSSLPDKLIYKILSYVDIVYSIRLSVLSSRLRFIWTSMPNLNFGTREVYRSSPYPEFVNNVLSGRNNKIDVSSVSLNLACGDTESSVKRTLEYAFSHNVQQLTIDGLSYILNCKFPLSLFSSKSLKHLTITSTTIDGLSYSSWDLPALTTLHLQFVKLFNCSSMLTTCHNLKNLTLERCEVFERESCNGFSIINSRLLNLTLKKVEWHVEFLLVDTPQLKNLIFVDTPQWEHSYILNQRSIRDMSGGLTISARELTYLRIKGSFFFKLSFEGFVEKVDLCISSPHRTDVHKICDLFQCLHSVKSLALSWEIVELLSASVEVISHQPSPFASLKSLKVYPSKSIKKYSFRILEDCLLKSLEIDPTGQLDQLYQLKQEQAAMEINLSTEVKNYLLDGSPNATFTVVSHEETRAIKVTKGTQRLMSELREHLKKIEANIENRRADVEQKKTLDDSSPGDFKMKVWGWGGGEKIFVTLQNVKELLNKVLASKRVEMQACFYRLCAEAETVVNKIIDDMKTDCDVKRSILSGYFNEFTSS